MKTSDVSPANGQSHPTAAPISPIRHAFTVDVEDYYQVDAFSDRVSRKDWPTFSSRVVENTRIILRMLGELGVKGTFYVLGYVAQQHPELVQEIHRDGHEVGCHGYGHQSLYRMTPDEFRADLLQATDILSDIVGERMTTYRAPNFSVRKDTLWALDILYDAGYLIDSSIFPVVHDRYGIPNAERAPHRRTLKHGSIWEFPPSVYRSRLGNVPIAGGGYFRLLPFMATRWFMRQTAERDGLPLMFYIHPWEVDPDQPRIPCSWKSRFRHYQNLRTTTRKLERLIRSFSFGTVSEALRAANVGFGEDDNVLFAEPLGGPHLSLRTSKLDPINQDQLS
jgi:polysaccharide deacetylase family protein (PEP-CTERM system associated)